MANQTVTTTVNHDSAAVAGLLDGEDYTINGGSVTVDADVRWGQNAAVIGNVTISSTLGGSFLIDGTQVWELPFTSSSGTVPALNALGSNTVTGGTSGATGELFRIWTAGSLTPNTTAGAPMPVSGWIKLRNKIGNFQAGEVVTLPGGATITISGPGKRSWVHMVGEEATAITIPRPGIFNVTGDWFELGTTNGADNQTFQFPVADVCPAIWVETAAGSGVYEIWLNAGSRWADAIGSIAQNDGRGKWFGQVNSTGVITIANRGTNPCGFKPPTGCRVRIPNVIWSNSTATNWAANTINATLATRQDFTTTSAGTVAIDKAVLNCYPAFTSPSALTITNSAILEALYVASVAGTTTITNVGIGLNAAQSTQPITVVTCFSPVNMTGVRAARYSATAAITVAGFADVANVTMTDCWIDCHGNTATLVRGGVATGISFARAINTIITNPVLIGCCFSFTTCAGVVVTNTRYADQQSTTTTTTQPHNAFTITTACSDVLIDGFSNFENLANVHPRTGIITVLGSSNNVRVVNIGTAASPYNMGTVNATTGFANCSVCTSLLFRRCYFVNEGGGFAFTNTVQNVEIINTHFGYARSQAISSVNTTMKGCKWTSSTTGQTAVYGTHWQDAFTSATTGRLVILCNEPLTATADQCVATFTGLSSWTATGSVSLQNVNDRVEWTMPYFMLGVTSLANITPTITGTNTANHSFEFQYDLGTGFNGTWLTLNGTNLAAVGTINPNTGVKLKVRATCTVASTSNLLTHIRIDTVTNATDQNIQYPLPVVYSVASITNLQAGSRIQIYNQTTATEVVNEVVAGTSYSFNYVDGAEYTEGDVVRVRITKVSGATAYLPIETLALVGATGFSILAQQELDTVYNTNAINGSTVTEFITDYPNIQIDVSDPDGSTRIDRLYAWWVHNQNTENGIRQWLGGLVAEDLGNYRIVTSKLNLKIDNLSSTGVQFTGGLRLYRDDGTSPLVASTTGGGSITMYADKVYIAETGVSGLTTEELAILEDARNKAALAASLSA